MLSKSKYNYDLITKTHRDGSSVFLSMCFYKSYTNLETSIAHTRNKWQNIYWDKLPLGYIKTNCNWGRYS